MKKLFLTLTMIFTIGMAFADKNNQTNHPSCEDFAFDMVDVYYDNGGDDGFEAGNIFEAAMFVCETVRLE